jgi:hypothetical protein
MWKYFLGADAIFLVLFFLSVWNLRPAGEPTE